MAVYLCPLELLVACGACSIGEVNFYLFSV